MSDLQNYYEAFLREMLNFLPILAKALLVLVIGWFLAGVLARIARKLSKRIGLSNLLERTGLAEGLARAEINLPPDQLLATGVRRIVQLGAVLLALEILRFPGALDMLRAVASFLPKLLAALISLIVGAMLAQFVSRLAQAAVASMNVEFHEQLGQLVRILLMIVVIIFAISQLGVDTDLLETLFTMLIVVALGAMGLAFGLGGGDIVRNLLAGHYLRERLEPGARISLDGASGELLGIGTVNAEIISETGQTLIPNRRLLEESVSIHGSDRAKN